MKFNIEEIIDATGAKVLKNEVSSDFLFEISTDTRTIKDGDFYLPLKGENFDGEKFIKNAIDAGAKGYFTTGDETFDSAKAALTVPDTKVAYLQLANFARKKINPKVVAITGSSGKTTTKEMAFCVASEKFKSHRSALNYNNEIGFCKTVLSMPDDTQVLIIEMGMRGFGEISLLSKYSEPDIGIIANVGTAHIGRLGSKENIACAKCEIIKYLKDGGTLIAHRDDLIKRTLASRCYREKDDLAFKKNPNCCVTQGSLKIPQWSRSDKFEKIYFSLNDVKILERKVGYAKFIYKDEEFELNIEGDYNVQNSLAAIEMGIKLGMNFDEIKAGLKKYAPIEKRWEMEKIQGLKVINDSYNANPESVRASVETFLELYSGENNSNKLLVVLGNMGELGENEVNYHREIGEFLAEKMLNLKNVKLITVGNLAEEIAKKVSEKGLWTKSFTDNTTAGLYILENIEFGTTIFLKASRTMEFEKIIETLKTVKK